MNNLIEFLKQEGVSAQLVEEVRHYSEEHTVDEALKKRIPVPHFHYYGNKVWEEALAVLLCVAEIFCWQERRQREKMCLHRILQQFLNVRHGIFPSMLIWMRLR